MTPKAQRPVSTIRMTGGAYCPASTLTASKPTPKSNEMDKPMIVIVIPSAAGQLYRQP